MICFRDFFAVFGHGQAAIEDYRNAITHLTSLLYKMIIFLGDLSTEDLAHNVISAFDLKTYVGQITKY